MSDKRDFDLSVFVDKLKDYDSISEEHIFSQRRMLAAFRVIVDEEEATDALLDSFTLTEIEWAIDLISYWPSFETDIEQEDWSHQGVQHLQIRDLVLDFKKTKSLKRKVSFI